MKIFLENLGCWKNAVDSENFLSEFRNHNFLLTNSIEDSDIIIVNTCTFIKQATHYNIKKIKSLEKLKRNNPSIKIIVYGCLVQLYKKSLLQKFNLIDKFFKISEQEEFVKYILSLSDSKKKCNKKNFVLLSPMHIKLIKISEGCNNKCNYCIIPKIRGKLISRPINDIIKEIKFFEQDDFIKEYVIIAQDTAGYGIDIGKKNGLLKLLNKIVKIISADKWIRIMYMHPKNFNLDILKFIRDNNVCKYFDLPLQHSEDKILQYMNRGYDKKYIYNIIENIRKEIPDATIRSTLIIGHPAESYNDFKNLLKFVKDVKFDNLGFYPYSLQKFSNDFQIFKNFKNKSDIDSRLTAISNAQFDIIENRNKNLIGKNFKVLFDSYTINKKYICGRAEFSAPEIDKYIFVKNSSKLECGKFYNIKLKSCKDYDFIGELTE